MCLNTSLQIFFSKPVFYFIYLFNLCGINCLCLVGIYYFSHVVKNQLLALFNENCHHKNRKKQILHFLA